MSWWDTAGLTSFASNVVKSAQKKIDKVLDIEDNPGDTTTKQSVSSERKAAESEGDFWNTWLGSPGEKAAKSPGTKKYSSGAEPGSSKEDLRTAGGSLWRSWGFEDSVEASEDTRSGKAGPGTQAHSPKQQAPQGADGPKKCTPKSTRQKLRQKTLKSADETVKDHDVIASGRSSSVLEESVNVIARGSAVSGDADGNRTGESEISELGSGGDEASRGVDRTTSVEESGPNTEDVKADQPHPPGEGPLEQSKGHRPALDPQEQVADDEPDAVVSPEGDAASLSHMTGVPQGNTDSAQKGLSAGNTPEVSSVEEPPEHARCGDVSEGTDFGTTEKVLLRDSSKGTSQSNTLTEMSPGDVVEDTLQIGISEDTGKADVQREGSDRCRSQDRFDADRDEAKPNTLPEEVANQVVMRDANMDVCTPEEASTGDTAQVRTEPPDTQKAGVAVTSRQPDLTGGLSVITEAGSETDSVTDDAVSTEQTRTEQTAQVCETDSMVEISVAERQASSSLTITDPVLDKSASTCSSIEIVSETEIAKAGERRTPSDDPRVHSDVSLLEEVPAGGIALPQEHSDSSDVSHLDSSADTCVSADTVVQPGREDSPVGSGMEPEGELPGAGESSMTVSSSSSVVKTMLEEAMEDSLKQEECDAHSHSSSDKSDFVKSEFSDKSISGHESGDEIDTTTSSDIEIISTPTPNGDRQERPFDLSPLKIALSRANRRGSPKHRRTDSQSSSSTNSKHEQLSPGRELEFTEDGSDSMLELSGQYPGARVEQGQGIEGSGQVSAEAKNDPYETEKLLKKMAEMAEVINARENKLVQLSKENNDLLEANSILRNQLKQSEETRETEMEDVNILTEEFTQRLGEAERKLQMSLREKDSLKKQLEITQMEMVKKGDTSKFQKMLAEKDEQIEGLLVEGEKLSKQQLHSNTIIKKLRSKEKENEQLIQSQKKKLESHGSELEHLKAVLDSKEDTEKKQSDAISQLNSAVQHQEKEIIRLKGELEDNQEKMRGMQVALDTSYKEIAELHRANAAKDSQAQEVAVSAEMQAREELRFTMERENHRYRQEKEALIMQIEDLRISLSRMEKEHGRREDMLRQEISDLQQRLQEDEARNQELTQSVTSATRPLLRQIENLQSTYLAQSTSWETVEKNITERLGEAQTALAVAVEKERMSGEKVLELSAQVTTLEAQNTRYRQEKSQMTAQLEMCKTKIEMLEDGKHSERAQVEAIRQSLNQDISELKREKILLENHLEMEKTKVENEKKKVALLQEQLKDKEKERPRSRGTPSPAQMTRQESISSIPDPLSHLPVFTQEELLERSLMMTPHSPNGNKMSLYETLRQTGAANLLESLTSQLKQREGEITQLQSEIGALERTRESMARELVNLSTLNDDLKEQIDGLPHLEAKHADLEQRYNALLQMYGEKVEETEELKLDLQDVKELYKSQIDHLMKGH